MIFPTLLLQGPHRGRSGYVHLDFAAEAWLEQHPNDRKEGQSNPLNDPFYCATMVELLHARLGVDFSYGGWLEVRSTLWRDSYLEDDQKFLHLGVDLNAPIGTEVAIDFDAEVVRVDDDGDQKGGWGPRVIFFNKEARLYIIYAHLNPDVAALKEGQAIKAGKVFSKVGHPRFNGGWYPHVHVQAITDDAYLALDRAGLEKLDGYGHPERAEVCASMFPDPLPYIRLR